MIDMNFLLTHEEINRIQPAVESAGESLSCVEDFIFDLEANSISLIFSSGKTLIF